MNKSMSQEEIFSLVGSKSNASKHLTKRVWSNFVSLIISELQNNSYIRFDNFGRFDLIQTGGKDEWFENEFGIKEKRYVDFGLSIKFTPSKNLIDIIENSSSSKWSTRMINEEDNLVENGTVRKNYDERTRLPIGEDMKEKIVNLAKKKKHYTVKDDKYKVENKWDIKIFCKELECEYKSILDCSKRLNLSYQKMNRLYHKAIQENKTFFEYSGYTFDIVGEKNNEE